MKSEQDHLSVAQALYQLNFYLQCLGLSWTVKDIYKEAYQTRRGDAYKRRVAGCPGRRSRCLRQP